MTMDNFKIVFGKDDLRMLRATLVCAGKKDERTYLNGINININREHVVATDSMRIAYFKTPSYDGAIPENGGFIIPSFKVPASVVRVEVEIDQDGRVTVTKWNKREEPVIEGYQSLDSCYPDYKSIMPERVKTEVSAFAFDPQLIADIQKVLKVGVVQFDFTAKGATGLIYVTVYSVPELTIGVMTGRM